MYKIDSLEIGYETRGILDDDIRIGFQFCDKTR